MFFSLILWCYSNLSVMVLNAVKNKVVVSVAIQLKKSGEVLAYVYHDSCSRTYEDCVRYGTFVKYTSLNCLIDCFLYTYEKVTISSHC